MAQKIVKLKDLVPGFSYKLAEDYQVKKIPGIMPGGLGDPYKAENDAKNKLLSKPYTFIFFDQSWSDTIAYFLDKNSNQKQRLYTHHGDKRVYYDVEINLKFLPNGLETNFIEIAPGIDPLAIIQGKSARNAYLENAAYNQSRPSIFAGLFQAQQGEIGAGAGAAAAAEEEAKNNNNVNMKLNGGKRRMRKSRKHSRKHTKKQKSRRKH